MARVPLVHVDAPLGGTRIGEQVGLPDEAAAHLHRVLRLRAGAEVALADGVGGRAPAVLTGAGQARVTAAVVVEPPPSPALVLVQALAKGRKLDEVVRTATELGVDAIVPVVTARSVVRPDPARSAASVVRWSAIARSACEQAGRSWRPVVAAAVPLAELPPTLPSPALPTPGDGRSLTLVASPGAPPLPDVLAACAAPAVVRVVVGPEGGLTRGEVDALTAGGALAVGLGPTVLRSEHAGVAALAVVAAVLGRWGTP